MKKLFALTMAIALLTAGSAMAAGRLQPNATFTTGAPATTNNDDSCDIAVTPAATLLRPVVDVDFNATQSTAQNTIFTIVNTGPRPQIAHITVWTDWSYPVLDFNVFLTGYDVQGINLHDLIGRGTLPGGGSDVTPGSRSLPNNTTGNPNFAAGAVGACTALPTQIPTNILADIQTALVSGTTSLCTGRVGSNNHGNIARGYITIDVANTCSQSLPTSPTYYETEILFDNVLTGDYQRINPTTTTGNYAGGESLVHIRAIPEGGPAGFQPTNLPYTFYDRYTTGARGVDRRQPLPALWAARYIAGGTGNFNTNLAIWREGITAGTAACTAVSSNAALGITEIVRFDERENPTTFGLVIPISPAPPTVIQLPEASRPLVGGAGVTGGSSIFPPQSTSGDVGGWMYLNLDNSAAAVSAYSDPDRASQNWVTVQMTAESRYGVDFDATYLGNGCTIDIGATATTPAQPAGFVTGGPIGPGIGGTQNATPLVY